MRRWILASAVAALAASEASADWRRLVQTRRTARGAPGAACQTCPASAPVESSGGGLALAKSQQQASQGRMAHVGTVPAGMFEGVGFSSSSPQQALDSCCYSNSGMRCVDQAVVPGRGGWFATKLFSR